MANSYTTPAKFLEWMPERYIGELSDDSAGLQPDNDKVQKALDSAVGSMESYLRVRTDIPIPAINNDDSVPEEILDCIYDLAVFKLFKRRGSIPDEIREAFDIQMTWLGDVSRRRANVSLLNSSGESETKTNDQPVTDAKAENKFNDFYF